MHCIHRLNLSLEAKCHSLMGGVAILTLIPINVYNFQFLYLFYVLGATLSKHKCSFRQNLNKKNYLILLMLFPIILFLANRYPTELTFYAIPNYILGDGIEISFDTISTICPAPIFIIIRYCVYIISTIFWLLAFLLLYQIFFKTNFVHTITSLGRETLFLFVGHLYILVCANMIITNKFRYNGILLNFPFIRYYILDTILCIVLIYLLYLIGLYIQQFKKLSIPLQGKI